MRKNISVLALCFFITAVNPAQIFAADASKRPILPGFERFSEGKEIDQAQLGLLLLGELNCTSCHAPTAITKGLIQVKQAPLLDKVAGRIKPEYFDSFIQNSISVGRYKNASEVVRAGLRLLEEEENRLVALKEAIQEGIESGIAYNFTPESHLEELKFIFHQRPIGTKF